MQRATSPPVRTCDVRLALELVDQVARHRGGEALAADQDRHAARVVGEEDRRLTGRVAAADEDDVAALHRCRLGAGRSVEDPDAGERVEPVGIERAVGDAARQDQRAGPERAAAVELHRVAVAGRRDALDAARHDDLGSQPHRLLAGARGEVVTGDAARKAEVVLDARRCARLSPGRLALDEQGAQALRGTVDSCCEARGPAADDHEVVGVVERLDLQPDLHGELGRRRALEDAAVRQQNDRAVVGHGESVLEVGTGGDPLLVGIGPLEAHLVAREEVAQAVARRVVRGADHDRDPERAGRLRLEALDALCDGCHEPVAEGLGLAHEQAELRAVDARHAQRSPRPGAGEERRAEHDRQLAEEVAGVLAHGKPSHPVRVALHEVERPGQQHVERRPTRPRGRATDPRRRERPRRGRRRG